MYFSKKSYLLRSSILFVHSSSLINNVLLIASSLLISFSFTIFLNLLHLADDHHVDCNKPDFIWDWAMPSLDNGLIGVELSKTSCLFKSMFSVNFWQHLQDQFLLVHYFRYYQ